MKPNPTAVRSTRNQYIKWLEYNWWRTRGWKDGFRDMVFWYSAAGAAVLGEQAAWSMLDDAKKGRKLPMLRQDTWRQAKALSRIVSVKERTNPVDWFTGGCGDIDKSWQSLDGVKYIGPKIASWLMRDLSLMRDYSDGFGGREFRSRSNINRSWYKRLPEETQALFVPVDARVHDAAKRCGIGGVLKRHGINKIQIDPDLHIKAATQIVRWARNNGYDPRDLDIYWYLTGSGKAE